MKSVIKNLWPVVKSLAKLTWKLAIISINISARVVDGVLQIIIKSTDKYM